MNEISTADFSVFRLRGQEAPTDLAILLKHADELREKTGVHLTDSKDWTPWADTSYLSEKERKQHYIAANIQAIANVCKQIAFVGELEDREYLGYWLGPKDRRIADSPLVVFDNEGQFQLCCGTTFAEAILERTYEQEFFDQLKGWFESIGIVVPAKSIDDLKIHEGDPDPAEVHSNLYDRYMDRA